MNFCNVERAFQQKKERGWNKIYILVDLHDCVISGKYNKFNVGAEIYPYAQQVLQYLQSREDICLILWTSSYKDSIDEITKRLKYSYGIEFDYFNENPECPNNELCDFSQKLYFNILIDDKSGWIGETDWLNFKNELIRIGEWKT